MSYPSNQRHLRSFHKSQIYPLCSIFILHSQRSLDNLKTLNPQF